MISRPETNRYREAISLDGIWQCTAEDGDWSGSVNDGVAIAVPGSWNEQLAEAGLMNHTGQVWYQREVLVPLRAAGKRVFVHFGSADYHATVYWNGLEIGTSGVLMMPFSIDLTHVAVPGETGRLTVCVTADLPGHGPMQRVTREDYSTEGRYKDEYYPAVRYDFFPFGGLNRPVHLCLVPSDLQCPQITTAWDGTMAHLSLQWPEMVGSISVHLDERCIGQVNGDRFDAEVDDVAPWSPQDPQLYSLRIDQHDERGNVIDQVMRRIGFRTVRVEGQQLVLNGEPITLNGFGKHEDTPVAGRGLNLPALIKDFQLLKWCGANSVRTSHYPYDETFLDLADEMGVMVVSEVFSVNLDFRRISDDDLHHHEEAAAALVARDGYHASVIAWSLSNEPGYLGEPEYQQKSSAYWTSLFATVRDLDRSRPLTVANVQYAGEDDPVFEHCDFISVNRYYGWYHEPGQLGRAREALRVLFDRLATTYEKPIFVSEFGADAIAGMHATTDQMWSEEYQADLIEAYWEEIDQHPAVIGGHVWNFADFRTAQHGRRAIMNRKGVFTRERDPKRAAFTLRRLWGRCLSVPRPAGEDGRKT